MIAAACIPIIGHYIAETVAGYDASAHMAEETRGADFSAPLAILLAIGASAVAGWIYVLALLFSIQVWLDNVQALQVKHLCTCSGITYMLM